jgi:hypothetical protein
MARLEPGSMDFDQTGIRDAIWAGSFGLWPGDGQEGDGVSPPEQGCDVSDQFVGKEAIEIEVAPGSVDKEAQAPGTFPFDAWSFPQGGSTSTPTLTLTSPWILEVATDLNVGGDLDVGGDLGVTGSITGDVTGAATGVTHQGTLGEVMRVWVTSIGSWNMDSMSTSYVSLFTDADLVRMVQVIIRTDTVPLGKYPLEYQGNGSVYIDITNDRFELWRATSGFFDSGNFDSTAFNRGWLTAVYVV